MHLTFKEYLVQEGEVTVTIDPNDPQSVRRAAAAAKKNPAQANRDDMNDAKADRLAAHAKQDPLEARIATLRMQIKQLEAKRAQQAK